MTDILQNGTTWLSLNHDITDKNYWISEVIVGSDPKKKGNKKDFTVIIVDSNRESPNDENGWSVIKKKNHGIKNPMFKKNRRNRKTTESSHKKSIE